MELREDVIIKTATGDLRGYLYVGENHLPELWVEYLGECKHAPTESVATFHQIHFLPATVPSAWRIWPLTSFGARELLAAWWAIQQIQHDLAGAVREAEEIESEADAKECERTRATENRIEEELDHDRP